MSPIVRLMTIALAFVLTACTSAPVHYHTMLSPIRSEVVTQPPAPFRIEVLPVGVPAQLDRSQLVVRQSQSGAAVLDGERWTSPLGDEVRDALSSRLADMLNTQDVAGLPVQSDKGVLRVKVQIRRLDAWQDQQVQLVADWELGFADAPERARVAHTGRFDEAAAGGYAGITGACQQAIFKLALRIASDARAMGHAR